MKWLSLFVGGQKWGVYLVSPNSKHLGRGKFDGRCYRETCKIYINKELDEQNREDTLLHELLHALLQVTGANSCYEQDEDTEEALVTAVIPAMHRLLKDLGFRFPRWN